MAARGIHIPALDTRPEVTLEVDEIIDIHNELDNFNGNLLDYCEFYGIKDLDYRNYLSICIKNIRKEVNKQNK